MKKNLLSNLVLLLLMATNVHAGPIFKHPPLNECHIKRGVASRTELDPNSIKVFVWNIYKGKLEGWREDFLRYGADRDLFMIQEAYSSDVVQNTLDEFNSVRWDTGVSFRFKKTNAYTGTMLGSTVEPTNITLARSKNKEPIVMTHKMLTIGTYPIQGHNDIMLITIHGMNLRGNRAFYRHVRQALSYANDHVGPVIFAGDFNSRNKRRTKYMKKILKKNGFDEMSFRNDERYQSKLSGELLDYSFTRGLRVVDSEVLGHVNTSDHKAMYFEVSVK